MSGRCQRQASLRFLHWMQGELGLVSAYHQYSGEAPGKETHPTYCYLWAKSAPFHIDYCFVPESWSFRLSAVDIGSYAGWPQSDHRPLTVDVTGPAARAEARRCPARSRAAGRKSGRPRVADYPARHSLEESPPPRASRSNGETDGHPSPSRPADAWTAMMFRVGHHLGRDHTGRDADGRCGRNAARAGRCCQARRLVPCVRGVIRTSRVD